jgi:hypothetical protein
VTGQLLKRFRLLHVPDELVGPADLDGRELGLDERTPRLVAEHLVCPLLVQASERMVEATGYVAELRCDLLRLGHVSERLLLGGVLVVLRHGSSSPG